MKGAPKDQNLVLPEEVVSVRTHKKNLVQTFVSMTIQEVMSREPDDQPGSVNKTICASRGVVQFAANVKGCFDEQGAVLVLSVIMLNKKGHTVKCIAS